ncbi:PAS domain-containing sensor histidine kinase [Flexithrix dorotheae]|uniref:PAS domain-containing sensor histidine kinase n=1 Tax=Flexithrix dorotheae TaxID=70993 RepID=UPI000375F727|nr:PAS domain-containing sensor histidine kinase [Flexithrix dorotheae]
MKNFDVINLEQKHRQLQTELIQLQKEKEAIESQLENIGIPEQKMESGFSNMISTLQMEEKSNLLLDNNILRALVNKLVEPLYLKDNSLRYIFVNEQFSDLIGLERQHIIGKTDFDLFSERQARETWEIESKLLNTGIEVTKERAITTLNEDVKNVVVKNFRVNDFNGHLFILGKVTDVTKQIKLTQKFLEQKATMQAVLDNTHELIWLVDRDKRLKGFNKKFTHFFKKQFNETPKLTMPFSNFLDNGHFRRKWNKGFRQSLSGKTWSFVQEFNLEGKELVLEVIMSPVVQGNSISGVSCYTKDLTLTDKFQNELEIKNYELKKENNALDSFVYNVSHDLKAPLSSLKGLIELVKNTEDPSQIDLYADLMSKSVNNLDRFIQDILEASKNSRIKVSKEEINLKEIVSDIFEDLSFMDEAERVNKMVNVKQTGTFNSDSRCIKAIMNNLITNAIRYGNYYLDNPKVEVTAEITQHSANITISDNGIGIPEDHLEKVFDMFYRANEEKKGSGIGLYLVKEAVAKLNGTIALDSKVGKGTTFTIVLPTLN